MEVFSGREGEAMILPCMAESWQGWMGGGWRRGFSTLPLKLIPANGSPKAVHRDKERFLMRSRSPFPCPVHRDATFPGDGGLMAKISFPVFPPPQPLRSVSGSSLSFLIPPPLLFSVNRLSIRLPPRISVSLENLHCFRLSLSDKERAGGIKRRKSLRLRYR